MCGIFGVIEKNSDRSINDCLDSIKHRGPDDSGQYCSENIKLGFRRLSIIDLSKNGHQPMANENGDIILICNGEIYNYQEIKKQLVSRHKFKSNTDIEVLIHGYEEWGIDELLRKINGMFAFYLFDKRKNVGYLVRDRIGKKPLYYYQKKGLLAFSSEAKAFLKLNEFRFGIDEEMFELFMGFPYLADNNKTIIKNVHKVSPGHYVLIKNDGDEIKKTKYWDLPQIENTFDIDKTRDNLEKLLIDAVKLRLEADVSVGILLSGGLDSSLITALASRNSKKQVMTMNISFKDSDIDERRFAKIVAQHCKTKHQEIHIGINDTYNKFKENIWIYDDLSTVDGGMFSEFLMAEKIRELGIKVVLVGEGADEIFGGYSWFQFSQFPFNIFPSFFNTTGYCYAISRLLPQTGLLKYSHILDSKLKQYSGDFFKKIQEYEIKYSLPNHYCMKVDKGTSAASIEARAPFMDYRIVELARKMDKKLFLKNNFYQPSKANEKYILRLIAEKYLPKEIYSRKKKGGMLPVQDILNVGVEKDKDLILNNDFLISSFGKKYLDKLINKKPKNKLLVWQREWVLWKCLTFALWFDYYDNYAKN